MQNQDNGNNKDEYDEILDNSFEDDLEGGYEDDFDDEFNDDLGDFDEFDQEAGQDEWNEQDSTEEAAVDPTLLTKEKKSGLNLSFNTIVIGGAVVLGIIVLLYQVMSTKPTQQVTDKFSSAISMSGATDGPIFEDANVEEGNGGQVSSDGSEDQGFLFDPSTLDDMEADLLSSGIVSESDKNPTIVLKTQKPVMMDLEDEPVEQKIPRAPENNVSDLIELDQANDLELSDNLDDLAENIKIPVSSPVMEPNNVNLNSAALAPLQEKLEMISSRLNQMDSRIGEVQEANNFNIERMAKAISEVKSDVEKLESKPPTKVIEKVIVKAEAVSKKPLIKEPAKKKASSPKEVTPKVVSKTKAPVWELRAAQPGKAWVSEAGESQMKPVLVGDSLDGIGRILDISYNNGRWILKGSRGVIRQ